MRTPKQPKRDRSGHRNATLLIRITPRQKRALDRMKTQLGVKRYHEVLSYLTKRG